MIVSTSGKTPQLRELSRVLKEEFSDRYSYKIFGLGSEKSIIVQKSTLVGVQITQRENEIAVDGTFPSVTTSFFSALISYAQFWIPALVHSSWRGLENEIAVFLTRKYG